MRFLLLCALALFADSASQPPPSNRKLKEPGKLCRARRVFDPEGAPEAADNGTFICHGQEIYFAWGGAWHEVHVGPQGSAPRYTVDTGAGALSLVDEDGRHVWRWGEVPVDASAEVR